MPGFFNPSCYAMLFRRGVQQLTQTGQLSSLKNYVTQLPEIPRVAETFCGSTAVSKIGVADSRTLETPLWINATRLW